MPEQTTSAIREAFEVHIRDTYVGVASITFLPSGGVMVSCAATPHLNVTDEWRAYQAAYRKGVEDAALLHDGVDPASDAERLDNIRGAGAMGAIIEYRDKIRTLLEGAPDAAQD